MLRELIPKIGLRANIYNKILLEKQAKQQIPEVVKIISLNNFNLYYNYFI